MDPWVIVAIPRQDSVVWEMSSEKVPHMTLLYLEAPKDSDEAQDIFEFVEHAASRMLTNFGLSVSRRGVLGDHSADVFFFDDGFGFLKQVKDFRQTLLLNESIKRAYDAVEQYPSWTPHLTLGYPEAPAKQLDGDRASTGWVEFDRLALWFGDFEGPEIQLTSNQELAMTDQLDDFLAHYGVKGMKWGVRKDRGGAGTRATTSKIARLDKKFEKSAGSKKTFLEVYNKASDVYNKQDIGRINNKPQYKGKDLSKPSPLRDKYWREHQDAFAKRLNESVDSVGTNASGTRKYSIRTNDDASWEIVASDVEHADEAQYRAVPRTDKMGHILGVDIEEASMTQSDPLDDFLAHYGVKGMKWGVRKDRDRVVRKDRDGAGKTASTRKIARLDKKFEKRTQSLYTTMEIYSGMAERMNNVDIPRINNKPQYKNADFTKDSPLRQKYYDEHTVAMRKNLEAAAKEIGTNASGTRRYTVTISEDGSRWDLSTVEVEHAASVDVSFKIIKDSRGHITGMSLIESSMEQSDLSNISDFLAHYGVKGMKWGVTRKRGSDGRVVSEDHKATRELLSKNKSELSNAEIRKINERLELEVKMSSLTGKTKPPTALSRGKQAFDVALNTVSTVDRVFTAVNRVSTIVNSPQVQNARKAFAALS